MSKLSHIESIRRRNASFEQKVEQLLGWTTEQYTEFLYEQGMEYLELHYPKDSVAISMAEYKEFWSWWRMHWIRRDKVFIEMTDLLFPHELEAYYKDLHDPKAMQFRIHSKALENTYEEMVDNLLKSLLK